MDFGLTCRSLRTQPGERFVKPRRSEKLNGRGAKSLGGKRNHVVVPLFIADDGHFLDVLTLFNHEAHVSPVSTLLPAFEGFKHDEGVDIPLALDGFLANLDDPIMIRLHERSPDFELQQLSGDIDYFYGHGHPR